MMDTNLLNPVMLNINTVPLSRPVFLVEEGIVFSSSVIIFPHHLFHSLRDWSGEQSVRVPGNRNRLFHS